MLRRSTSEKGYSPRPPLSFQISQPRFCPSRRALPPKQNKGPHPLISIGLRRPPGDHHSIAVMQKHCQSVSLALVCEIPLPFIWTVSVVVSHVCFGGSNVRTHYTDSRCVIHLLAFISHAYLIRQPCYFSSIISRPPFVHVAFRPVRKSHFSGTIQKSHSKQIAMMPSHAHDLFLLTYR